MSLGISIAPASDIPIFRQLLMQIHREVALGRIKVGEQLPAVRVMAESLLINPNTVARAYQELIREGVLESRTGRGVFVVQRRQVFSDAERVRRLTESVEELCHEALLLDVDLAETRTLLESTWKKLQHETVTVTMPEERKKK